MDKRLIAPTPKLINALREHEGETEAEIKRKNWRSLLCRACGVCCHSSLVPVERSDCDRLWERMGVGVEKEQFATLLLQPGGENRPTGHLETKRYGGSCLFLERKEFFACAVWEKRLDVCRDFFCYPMVAFAACEAGEEQEMFDPEMGWEERFSLLFDKVAEEVMESLFVMTRSAT